MSYAKRPLSAEQRQHAYMHARAAAVLRAINGPEEVPFNGPEEAPFEYTVAERWAAGWTSWRGVYTDD